MSGSWSSLKQNRRAAGALAVVAAAALALGGVAPAAEQGEQGEQSHGPAYKDARKPVDVRVRDLLGRMTLAEKVGQMGQINAWVLLGDPGTPWDWPADFNPAIVDDVFKNDKIGSVLSGGGAWPAPPRFANDGRGWAQFTNEVQRLGNGPVAQPAGHPDPVRRRRRPRPQQPLQRDQLPASDRPGRDLRSRPRGGARRHHLDRRARYRRALELRARARRPARYALGPQL